MKSEKMSLDAFKEMAGQVQTNDAMLQIEGGNLFNCHGDSGRIGKAIGGFLTDIAVGVLERI